MNFMTREKGFSATITDMELHPEWSLKLQSEYRRNIFDSVSCLRYFKEHSLLSYKHSVSLNYQAFLKDIFIRFQAEYAIIRGNDNQYLKLEGDLCKSYIINSNLKIVNFLRVGFLYGMSLKPQSLNDRYFNYFNNGFWQMGKTEPPIQVPGSLKPN